MRRRMPFVLFALTLSTAAWGGLPGHPQSRADLVADKFLADAARMPPAPNPKMAKDLKALVACSADRIRHSVITNDDRDAAINAKVQAAMKLCSDQVYGPAKP